MSIEFGFAPLLYKQAGVSTLSASNKLVDASFCFSFCFQLSV